MNKKQQHGIVGGVLKMNSERIRPKGVNKGKRYRKRTPKTSEKKREENRPSQKLHIKQKRPSQAVLNGKTEQGGSSSLSACCTSEVAV